MFLDGYASVSARRGRPTVVVHWPDWLEAGMAVDHKVAPDTGFFRSVRPDEGIAGLDQILRSRPRRVIAGDINYPLLRGMDGASLESLMRASPIGFSGRVAQKIWSRPSEPVVSRQERTEVLLTGRANNRYSPTEQQLAVIWSAELGTAALDVNAGFFDLGGDSLIALRLANSIRQRLGRHVAMAQIFQYLTIAELARYLDGGETAASHTPVAQEPSAVDGYPMLPLSYAQRGLWLLEMLAESGVELNLPMWYDVEIAVSLQVLRSAVNLLIARHDALRLVVRDTEHGPRQTVLPPYTFELATIDVSREADPAMAARRHIDEDNAVAFDLSQPMLRGTLFRLADARYRVYFNMHHLIADGLSVRIFLTELAAAYEALVRQREPELPELPVSFCDHLREQESWLKSSQSEAAREYWLDQMRSPLPRLDLADLDGAGPAGFAHQEFDFDQEVSGGVRKAADRMQVTVHTYLLSIYVLVLADICQTREMVVGIPFSGRYRQEVENLIGLFVNNLAVRLDLNGTAGFADVVSRVNHQMLRAYEHSRYPFEKAVENAKPKRDAGRNPVFLTAFQFTEFLPPADMAPQFDMGFYGHADGPCLEFRLTYHTARLSEARVNQVVESFIRLVTATVQRQELPPHGTT
jgi:acyl carrier protein